MTTQNIYQLTDVWNAGGTTFTGIGLSVTDTASAAGSLLLDLQVGGSSKFKVAKGGNATASGNIGADGGNSFLSGTSLRIGNSNGDIALSGSNLQVNTGSTFGWSDIILARDAADTLAQRNGTNAQAFRVYNTFTDASNYERGRLEWSSNVFIISTSRAGTGSSRELRLQTDGASFLSMYTNGTARWAADGSGHFIALTDNVYDIGASNATRPRNIYAAGFVDSDSYFRLSSSGTARIAIYSPSDGVLRLSNGATTDFSRLQFGGTTSSFPALKRSSTTLQARLADDSAFAPIQGKLTTETAYTAGDPVTTGYLTLYDSNGTAYKVPAVAA